MESWLRSRKCSSHQRNDFSSGSYNIQHLLDRPVRSSRGDQRTAGQRGIHESWIYGKKAKFDLSLSPPERESFTNMEGCQISQVSLKLLPYGSYLRSGFPYIQRTTARILLLTRSKAQSVSVKLPTVDWNNICDEKSLKKACECRLFSFTRTTGQSLRLRETLATAAITRGHSRSMFSLVYERRSPCRYTNFHIFHDSIWASPMRCNRINIMYY